MDESLQKTNGQREKQNGNPKATSGDEMEDDYDTKCGIGSCKPRSLQIFANMLPFTLYYGLTSFITSALSLYLTSQVTTLEKQFGLSSSQTGILMSMNDFGFLALVVFISHFTRYAHKPRILGFCVLLFGVSAIISAVPHFVTPRHHLIPANSTNTSMQVRKALTIDKFRGESICSGKEFLTARPPSNISVTVEETCQQFESHSKDSIKYIALGIISAGMFLQGVAKSPRMSLTQTYIDDNVIKTKTGFYIGIIACMSIFGPAVAFAVGAQISRIYVTLEDTNLSYRDPRWVGAWWLGFLIFGFAALIVSGPLFFFPRRMVIKSKDAVKERAARAIQKNETVNNLDFIDKSKDMPKALWRLVTNFTYMCLVVGSAIDFFAMAGGLAFGPKFLEVYFGITIFKANMLMGTTSIVAASTGMLVGGFITRKLKLDLVGCLKMIIVVRVISGIIGIIPLFLNCPQPYIIGLSDHRSLNQPSVVRSNGVGYCPQCSCHDEAYFPVCGSDGRNYFSPCVAGCSSKLGYSYSNCSCVLNGTLAGHSGTEFTAVPGLCPAECGILNVFIAIQVLGAFLGTFSGMPTTVASIRSVSEKDKTTSIGLSSFAYSLIGWTLGPMVFGVLVDGACTLWHTSCSKRGSCAVYDIYDLRNKMIGLGIAGRIICLIVLTLCLLRLTCFLKVKDQNSKDAECAAETEKMLTDENSLEPNKAASI